MTTFENFASVHAALTRRGFAVQARNGNKVGYAHPAGKVAVVNVVGAECVTVKFL